MTQPKNEPRVSEKRPYSYAPKTQKRRGCLSVQEIAALFVAVGWLGRRRPELTDHRGRLIQYWGGLADGRQNTARS
jgi:hypothetical protein